MRNPATAALLALALALAACEGGGPSPDVPAADPGPPDAPPGDGPDAPLPGDLPPGDVPGEVPPGPFDWQGEAPAPGAPGLLVATTRALRDGSAVLPGWVDQRREQGWAVRVLAEDDWGGDGLQGQDRALALRAHLGPLAAAGWTHLLLAGDGHPAWGDVPMMTVWPRHAMPASTCGGAFALDCRSCQTDMMYADLSGDWDRDGDGRFGEHGDDDGPGGIDFVPELVVGRIPAYFQDARELDRALAHALAHAAAPVAGAPWRDRLLLPAAIFYFPGQRLETGLVTEGMDGADIAEWLVQHRVRDWPGVEVTRLYERAGGMPSRHAGDGPLDEEALAGAWNRGVGMVFWFAHGMPDHVSRVVWNGDDDGDGLADDAELSAPDMLRSPGAEALSPPQGAFVVATSCEVGSADVPYNLAQALLLGGAAVGVAASTSVTPGDVTDYPDGVTELDATGYGATNGGIVLLQKLREGKTGARALAEAKVELGTAGGSETWAARMMINWFGDPTLRLKDPPVPGP